jgi:putative hydrolase of the HAD superfamily
MDKVINTIIFDYAGVLTPTQGFDTFIDKYSGELKLTKEQLYVFLKRNWQSASTGNISSNIYWSNLANDIGLSIEATKKNIVGTFPLNNNIFKVIKKLKENYNTVLMSNQIRGWIEDELLPEKITDYFTQNFSSYIIGIKKPNKSAYEIILNQLKVEGNKCLYFDDQKENIMAALDLGINSVQFYEDTDINKELEAYNIFV